MHCFSKSLCLYFVLYFLGFHITVTDTCRCEESRSQDRPANVLMLYTWYKDLPWQKSIESGLKMRLAENRLPVRLYVEYIDGGRFILEDTEDELYQLYKAKYSSRKIDIVISEGLSGAIMLERTMDLFPDAQKLAVRSSQGSESSNHKDLLQMFINENYIPAIQVMMDIYHPKQIAVIADISDKHGKKRLADFKVALENMKVPLPPIKYLTGSSLETIIQESSALPPKSAIFYLLYFQDENGNSVPPYKAAQKISSQANAPVFSHWDSLMGSGIVGGFVLSGEKTGAKMADAIWIFANQQSWQKSAVSHTRPDDIFEYQFDSRQLQRWNISKNRLPKDSRVLFEKPGIVQSFPVQASLLIGGIISLSVLLLSLLLEIQKRKDATRQLEQSEERFDLAMKFSNDGLFDWDLKTGRIYFSPGWKHLLGYKDHEIKNEFSEWERLTESKDVEASWEMLNEVLNHDRDSFNKEFKMRHKDGRWVEILSRANVIFDENGVGQRVVGTHVDITPFKQAQKRLEESELKLKIILQANPDPLVLLDHNRCPQYLNPAFSKTFGWFITELEGAPIPFVPDDQKQMTDLKIKELFTSEKPVKYTTQRLTKMNEQIDVIINSALVKDVQGNAMGMIEHLTDISEQKKLEMQIRHAQRLESIGRLAGGVAHDFNNMLSVIIGNAEMVQEEIKINCIFSDNLNEIQNAAHRSKKLVRQLLAFARKQTISPKILDLNIVTENTLSMLHRLIGEDIRLIWKPCPSECLIKIDPSQLDQILANLCVNAKDAINGSGDIHIETQIVPFENMEADDDDELHCGNYIKMIFSDNGCGMDKNTLEKLFDPFFTTKDVGQGTGLGMATVYGIICKS